MTTHATVIRDALFDLLSTLPGYTKVRKVAQRQLQPEDCPCITVVRGEELMSADEDATAGQPHFVHNATFHISVIRGVGDPVVIDGDSDADMDRIQDAILRTPSIQDLFEGILSIRRSTAWPQQGDAYYAELRLELTVQYRSTWPPFAPDEFLGADVTLVPGGDADAAFSPYAIDIPQGRP